MPLRPESGQNSSRLCSSASCQKRPIAPQGDVWVSLFDHLVSAQYEPGRDLMADRLRGLEIDDQLEPRRLLDRQIRRLDAAQQLGELPAHDVSVQLNDQRSISDEAALLRHFRPLVHGGQAQGRNAVEYEGATVVEKR